MELISERLKEGLEKNTEARLEDVNHLREWCKGTNLPVMKDYELLEFLHSCLYDVDSTKKCLEAYFKIRRTTPELFTKRYVSEQPLKDYIANVLQCFPIGATKDGNQIILYRLLSGDPHLHTFTLDIQLLSLAAEVLQYKFGTIRGITIMSDFDKAGVRHMLWAKWKHLRIVLRYLQEAFPIRMEAIHTLSSTTFMNYGILAIKPFTSSNIISKMTFHKTADLRTLYEKIPKENLPEEYGGLLPSCDKLNREYIEEVDALRTYFDEKDAFESLQPSK